eukprot:473594-Prymnesium_polylepis.1
MLPTDRPDEVSNGELGRADSSAELKLRTKSAAVKAAITSVVSTRNCHISCTICSTVSSRGPAFGEMYRISRRRSHATRQLKARSGIVADVSSSRSSAAIAARWHASCANSSTRSTRSMTLNVSLK